MKCCGHEHRILWKNGSLVLLDHSKERRESDEAMVKLGAKIRCQAIFDLWVMSARYKRIHHKPWIPAPLIPPLEEAIRRGITPFEPLSEYFYPWATPGEFRDYFERKVRLLAGDAYSRCHYREPAGDNCQDEHVGRNHEPRLTVEWGQIRDGRRQLHTSINLPYRWYSEVYLTGNAVIDGCFVVEYFDDELVLAGRPARQGCLVRVEKAQVVMGRDGNRHLKWLEPYRTMSTPRPPSRRKRSRLFWSGVTSVRP